MSRIHLAWTTTGNRVSIQNSLWKLAENALEHGHKPKLLLACDAESSDIIASATSVYRSTMETLELGGAITTLKDRWQFVRSAPPHLDRSVLENAVIPQPAYGQLSQLGTNQNAILLATAGELTIKTDDDVITTPARVAASIDGQPEFSPSFLPARVTRHPDRDSVLRAVKRTSVDVVGAHLSLLCSTFDIASAGKTKSGTVLTTTSGAYGDSGSTSSRSFLVIDDGRREEYYDTKKRYDSLKLTRETIRIPDRVYVGPGRHLTAMNLGLDNQKVLPPFIPVGRGSDSLFILLTRVIYPDSLTGFLDFGLLHDPPEPRMNRLENLIQLPTPVAEILMPLVVSLAPKLRANSPETRYSELGEGLFNLATSDLSDFALFVHAEWSKAVVKYVEHLESLIDRYNGEPQYWRRDVELHLDRLREALREPTSIFGEQGCGLSPERFAEQTRLFGRLLVCWPELWEWAKSDPEGRRGLVSTLT